MTRTAGALDSRFPLHAPNPTQPNPPDVVWMRFKRGYAFLGVVVVASEMEVVGAADEPVLAGDEGDGADRDLCDLERLYERAGLVVPDEDVARVESGEDPRLGRMKVDGFDA